MALLQISVALFCLYVNIMASVVEPVHMYMHN